MKNKRREFIRKTTIAGFGLAGLGLVNNNPFAHDRELELSVFKNSSAIGELDIYQSIKIISPPSPGVLTTKAINLFKLIVNERTGKDFFQIANDSLVIKLWIDSKSITSEAFRIEDEIDGAISITAGDENGILYGLGKFLHSSSFTGSAFSPGRWRGTSISDKPFRAIYFATHFHNFYQDAPIKEVIDYLEELALWGINCIVVWFDMHSYNGIQDQEAQTMLDRLSQILHAGKSVGMKTGIAMLANEGYKNSPRDIRANPYTNRAHYHVETCPSLPGGSELILRQVNEELDAFSEREVTIDRIILWPYDQGGCGCVLCEPWGSNGYLKISKKIYRLVSKKLPVAEIILSTWLFDFQSDQGEWSGLTEAFKKKKPFADYIMADSHTTYPKYPLDNPVPGDLPLLNFPEISMWEGFPWGAYGATPLPERFQKLWNVVSDKVAGGFPYSEGIFEDINKVIYSQFYWNRHKFANETLKEYVSYEFSPEFADNIIEAIKILEKNWGLSTGKWATIPGSRNAVEVSPEDYGAEKAYKIMQAVDNKLPYKAKTSWRWRLLLLRSMLDYQLRLTNGVINNIINAGFEEICRMQHLENGEVSVRPPVNYGKSYPIKVEWEPIL